MYIVLTLFSWATVVCCSHFIFMYQGIICAPWLRLACHLSATEGGSSVGTWTSADYNKMHWIRCVRVFVYIYIYMCVCVWIKHIHQYVWKETPSKLCEWCNWGCWGMKVHHLSNSTCICCVCCCLPSSASIILHCQWSSTHLVTSVPLPRTRIRMFPILIPPKSNPRTF